MGEFSDLSNEELLAALKHTSAEKPDASLAKGIVTEYAQGASFGTADEGRAAIEAALNQTTDDNASLSDDYRFYHDNIQQERDAFIKEHPYTAFGSQLAGGMSAGLPGMKRLAATQGFSNLAPALKFAIPGGAGGLLYGAGAAQPGERLEGAVQGAGMGFGTGLLMHPALQLTGAIANKVGQPAINYLRSQFTGPQTQAMRHLRQAFQRDNVDEAQAIKNIKDSTHKTVFESGGANTRELADTVTNMPGKSPEMARQTFSRRQGPGQQASRLVEGFKKIFGTDKKYLESFKSLTKARRDAAKGAYDEAFAVETPFNERLAKILETPMAKSAWKKAQKAVADDIDDAPLPEIFETVMKGDKTELKLVKLPNTKAWHHIKRGLDEVIEKETDSLTGAVSSKGRAAVKLKHDLLTEMDAHNKPYQAARSQYASDSANIAALKRGKRVLLEDAEDIADDVAKMSDSETEAYLIGVMKAVRDKVVSSGGGTNDPTKSIINNGLLQERIAAAFDDPLKYQQFMRLLQRETGFKAFQNSLGNSKTAARLARQSDMGKVPTSPTEAVVNAAGDIVQPGMPEQVRDDVGSAGFASGRQAQDVIPRIFQKSWFDPTRYVPDEIINAAYPTAGLLYGQQVGRFMANP